MSENLHIVPNPKYPNIFSLYHSNCSRMWTSSSSSASRSLSSSTSSSTFNSNPRFTKTMEDVWKEISFASDLPHHHHPHPRGVILQDFFSKDPTATTVSSSPPPPPPPPPTMLTLSSAPDHFSALLFQPHHQPISHVQQINVPFDTVVPGDNRGGGEGAGKKRFPDFERSSGGGDRRHKRMIKNRESAARSRARKQAYTNELELEVAHLLEVNARLKEQQQQLCRAAAAQHQKKKPLLRTSTAPF